MARLIEMEEKIKEDLARDREDYDTLYKDIYDLCYNWIWRGKKMSDFEGMKEVAYILTQRFIIMIINHKEPHSWLGYIPMCFINCIYEWRSQFKSELFETSDDPKLQAAIEEMCTSSSKSMKNEYDEMYLSMYIEKIPNVIETVLQKSRIKTYTKDYENAKLSLLLSVYYKRFVSFNLSEYDKPYCKLIYDRLASEMGKELAADSGEDFDLLFSDLQLHAMTEEGGYNYD